MSSSGQPFPMSKLVYMYVKRLAQPLATRIIARAKTDQIVKKYLCLQPANLYHFYEAKVKFKVMNIGKVRMNKVPKLLEKDAMVLGANLFSEMCIYAVASGGLKMVTKVYTYHRFFVQPLHLTRFLNIKFGKEKKTNLMKATLKTCLRT
eukprot:GFUD01018180.1.p1 GENE.GFUD01018180.1~~GFUD01018180.1.p1  ORF type:complete len:149 (+),score=9.94 GFUD01018180.1:78-524(+)